MRTFIAIDIPEQIKEKITEIQKKLPEFKGNFTEEDNLHLTLKFLGEIDKGKIEEIKDKLKEIKYNPFEAEIDSMGVFDNRKSGKYEQSIIAWLHVKNCDGLQKKVDEILSGLFEKEKRFMSHLTIARIKNLKDKKEVIKRLYEINIPKMKFYVNTFNLKESILTSKGSIYKDIEIYKLEI